MLKNSLSQLFVLAVACLLPSFVVAQAPTKTTETTLTVLRVADQNSTYIGNQAALSGDDLSIIAANHIQQALVRIPGVNFHHNSGQEYLPAVRSPVLTGAGACGSFLMAEDGIALRPAGFCNVNELFEAHSEIAQRIEVIRGPSVALYGSNALHGIVNVITPDVASTDNHIALEAGSEDYYRITGGLRGNNVSANYSATSDGGFRAQSGVDQQKLSLRHNYSNDSVAITSGLTAVNLNQETAGFITGKDSFKNKRLSETNPNPEAHRDAQALRLWSRISSQQASWVVTPYVRYSDMMFLQHFLPGTPLEENGQWSAGVQTVFVQEFASSSLNWGVDAEYFDGELKQGQLLPTSGSAFLQETVPQGKHYDYTVRGYQLAPFVQWQVNVSDALSVIVGARAEWLRYDYDNKMLAGRTRDDGTVCGFGGCRYSRPADRSDDFSNISPKLALNYQLTDTQTFFATLARGFRVPQAVELYRLQRAQTVADLDSEQLDSLELGWRGKGEKFAAEAVLYAMKKRHVIFRDSSFFNVADGRTKHYGVELGGSYALADSLSLGLSASYAKHRYDKQQLSGGLDINGNEVDTAPRHFGSVNLNWQPSQHLLWQLEWLHTGRYFTDPENAHSYEGHDLFNLRGELALSPALKLHAKIRNVADSRYAERADFTSFSGDRYLPGESRAVYLGATLQW